MTTAKIEKSTGQRRRYWLGLVAIVLLLLIAGGYFVVRRVRWLRQQPQLWALKVIQERGGQAWYEADGERREVEAPVGDGDCARKIVLVNLRGSEFDERCMEALTCLPALDTLIVGGRSFTDVELNRLKSLSTLNTLMLDSTAVTPIGLDSFKKAMPGVEVLESKWRAAQELCNLGGYVGLGWERRPASDFRVHEDWYLLPLKQHHSPDDDGLGTGLGTLMCLPQYQFGEERPVLRALVADKEALPYVENLSSPELELRGQWFTDAEAEWIASQKYLHVLVLDGTSLSEQAIQSLKALPHVKFVAVVNTGKPIELFRQPFPDRLGLHELLTEGLVKGSKLEEGEPHLLKDFEDLRRQRHLVFPAGRRDGEEDEWVKYFEGLTGVTRMTINRITGSGLKRLQRIEGLKWLTLSGDTLDESGLEHLQGFKRLVNLELTDVQMTDEGLAHLGQIKGLTQLRLRPVSWSPRTQTRRTITGAGLMHLKCLRSLEELALSYPWVIENGLAFLREMRQLKELDLRGTRLTHADLSVMREMTWLRTLKLDSGVDQAVVNALRQKLPKTRIITRE